VTDHTYPISRGPFLRRNIGTSSDAQAKILPQHWRVPGIEPTTVRKRHSPPEHLRESIGHLSRESTERTETEASCASIHSSTLGIRDNGNRGPLPHPLFLMRLSRTTGVGAVFNSSRPLKERGGTLGSNGETSYPI
jgi:hypothetical protein